jgi:hypothetical protein
MKIERHPQGPRVWVRLPLVGWQRVHHASAALVLAAICVVHDWQDHRDWFRLGAQR